ncbi:MAG: CPBP family intramembrane glutamic endopeptidase [Candidatus Methanospirareceae archaeon]
MSDSKLLYDVPVRISGAFFSRRAAITLLYILLITAAELVTAYAARHGAVFAKYGIAFHAVLLFVLLVHSARILKTDPATSKLLLALIIAPLIRILSLSMPVAEFSYIAWFSIISIPVYITIFACLYLQHIPPEAIGLALPAKEHLPLELAMIVIAVPVGIMEYLILQPGMLVEPRLTALVVPVLIMIVCTGFLEELAFRGLMQYHAVKTLGFAGIVLISALFGLLHVGNLTIFDVLLAGSIGFIYALVVRKTGSLYGVSISHGIINSTLFLFAPLYL